MPTETVKKALPWRAGVPAWIMAVEGLVIALLGLFVLGQPSKSTQIVLLALGALMLFNGIPRLSRYYSGPSGERSEADLLHGWYGTITGGGAILLTLIVQEDNLSGVVILMGIALVIAGLLELYERFTAGKGNRRLAMFIMPIILLLAGGALISVRVIPGLTVDLIGQILALLGFALLALGLIRVYGNYSKRHELEDAKKQRDQLDQQITAAKQSAKPAAAPAAPAPAPAPAAPAAPVAAPPAEPEDPAVAASRDVTS